MENITNLVNSIIGGLKVLLISAAGLLIIAQIVIGNNIGFEVVDNITALLNSFIGSEATLVSVITGIIVLGLLSD